MSQEPEFEAEIEADLVDETAPDAGDSQDATAAESTGATPAATADEEAVDDATTDDATDDATTEDVAAGSEAPEGDSDGDPLPVDGNDAVANMTLIDAAYRAAGLDRCP